MHQIRPARGAAKKRKRVGRGNASGHGTYSGHGLKGQKARSGVSNLKRLGMKQVLLRTPKKRGFKSLKPKNQAINLDLINVTFKDGDKITPRTLLRAGLVDTVKTPVKILGRGVLGLKGLKFEGVKMSASAKRQLGKTAIK
jgi:large subunit ribosomal protein L15